VSEQGGHALPFGQIVGENQVDHAGDAVHRRANLVAHVGQEFAPHHIRRLRLSGPPLGDGEQVRHEGAQLTHLFKRTGDLRVNDEVADSLPPLARVE